MLLISMTQVKGVHEMQYQHLRRLGQIKARPTMDSNIVHKVWSLMKGPDPLTFTGASNIEIIYMFTPVECFVVIWLYSLFLVFPTCKTRVFYQFSSKISKHLVV